MELSAHMLSMYHREVTIHDEDHHNKFMGMMGRNHHHHHHDAYNSDESISSSFEDSSNSKDSSSSELLDDASSSSSSSSSSSPRQSNGPLYELSELMDQLPIKRGLSKHYNGKSQSFTSLAKVASLEDLAKKETPYQRRLKACRSYGGGLSNFRSYTSPKSGISKKVSSKGSLSNLSACLTRKASFTCRPPLSPVQSSF